MKTDEIFKALVAQIEKGTAPWQRPWSGGGLPRNASTRKEYRGSNVLCFWGSQAVNQFSTSQWIGYQQAIDIGGQVRKGEKSSWGITVPVKKLTDKNGNESFIKLPPRPFFVFNLDQVDGLDHLRDNVEHRPFTPIESAEKVLADSGAVIHHRGDSAFYARDSDQITLPERTRFLSESGYYATALHELVHWTGAEHRLNRTKGKRFGDSDYAFEELIAEIGSAMTQARIGLDAKIEHHASYLESWLSSLKNDPKALINAASLAQAASDYIVKETTD